MPKVMKVCKVCGKEYEACHTPNPGVWRWRDVACCIEHAEQYLHDVQVARGEIVEENADHNTLQENTGDAAKNADGEVITDEKTEDAPTATPRRSRKK